MAVVFDGTNKRFNERLEDLEGEVFGPGGSAYRIASRLNGVAGTTVEAALVTATGSTTARPLKDRAADVVWAEDEGAKGDGSDDTAAIQAALNKGKPVRLRAGRTYSVTGLTAVAGSALIADGPGATISLAVGGTKALTIAVNDFRVEGISFSGGNLGPYNAFGTATGTRFGIYAVGPSVANGIRNVSIEDCSATGFDHSGLYIKNTGQASGGNVGLPVVKVSRFYATKNCHGIFLDDLGEYVQIVNSDSSFAWVAIRVSGGNNRVVNSHFSRSWRNAMLRGGANAGHGSFVACSFNHAEHIGEANPGIGVDAGFLEFGHVFVGCEFWYSPISIVDSSGVLVTGSQIAHSSITTQNSGSSPVTSAGTNYFTGNWLFGTVDRTFDPDLKTMWRGNIVDGQAEMDVPPYVVTLTYAGDPGGTTYTIDAAADFTTVKFVVNDGNPFTFLAPTNGYPGKTLRIHIKALAALTAAQPFTLANGWRVATWTPPPNGSCRVLTFVYDGYNWYQSGVGVDVTN